MNSQYRPWHLPALAFYSKKFYRDIAENWKGTNLGLLLLLLAACMVPAARHIGQEVNAYIDRLSSIYLMQIPDMRIFHGRVSVDAPQPYSIIGGNRTVLVIDTTGRINTLDEADADALLTTTRFYFKQAGRPPATVELSSIDELEINQQIVAEWIRQFKKLIAPSYYLVGLLVSSILFVLSALLFGAIALLFGSIQKRKLDYATGLRLSVAAFTPPLIISTALNSINRPIPALLCILLALAYLYMAVGSIRKEPPAEPFHDEAPVNH